jgi:hypothetical protein
MNELSIGKTQQEFLRMNNEKFPTKSNLYGEFNTNEQKDGGTRDNFQNRP